MYDAASPGFTGRCTAPLLVDKKTKQIVCNESSDIVRMLNAVQLPGCTPVDLYPAEQQQEIDELNSLIYGSINNGVYRCGFATSQPAYDQAVQELYGALEQVERRLAGHRFLAGNRCVGAAFSESFRFISLYILVF